MFVKNSLKIQRKKKSSTLLFNKKVLQFSENALDCELMELGSKPCTPWRAGCLQVNGLSGVRFFPA